MTRSRERFSTLNNSWIHCDTGLMKVEDLRDCNISQSWLTQLDTPQIERICSAALRTVSGLIIYMEKFLHSDWLRAVQFFLLNSAEKS